MECLRSVKVKLEIDTNKRTIEEEWDNLPDAILGLVEEATSNEFAFCNMQEVIDRLSESYCFKCGHRSEDCDCQCKGDN